MHLRGRNAGPSETTSAGLVLLYSPAYEVAPPVLLFQKEEMTVGRDESSDLVLYDAASSGRHAVIRREGGRWHIRDEGSRNGLIVNGEHLRGEVVLEPSCEVRLGDSMFKFVPTGAEGYEEHRIDGVLLGDDPPPKLSRDIVGGAQIQRLLRRATRAAKSTVSVVFTGESGTGKELFAAWTHETSGRKGPFIPVNCGAFPETLLEAELFGAAKGAYTGAHEDREGVFRAAHGGTLFLDELGDMPLPAQAKLLRAVEDKMIRPLGSTTSYPVDVRIVCATHRDLPTMVSKGQFRADLLARLSELTIALPPLRERKEDIFLLARTLLARRGFPRLHLSTPFMTGLLAYDYPNNVRDLARILLHATLEHEEDVLTDAHFPEEITEVMRHYAPDVGPSGDERRSRTDPEDEAETERDQGGRPPIEELVDVLVLHHGNIAAVGRHYQRTAMTVRRWVTHYKLDVRLFR